MKVEHGAGHIHYRESSNRWYPHIGEDSLSARGWGSLSEARKALDAHFKDEADHKTKFTRRKAFLRQWHSGPQPVEVTSLVPEEQEAWVLTIEKRRLKVKQEALFAWDDLNKELVAEMQNLHLQATALQARREELGKRLNPAIFEIDKPKN